MGKWMPVEDLKPALCACGNCTNQIEVEGGKMLSLYDKQKGIASILLPDDLRLCRLTDAPVDMPDSVRATMREALANWEGSIGIGESFYKIKDMDATLAAIDAARAYLDALP